MNTTNNNNEIFPKGEKASADYFTGTAYVKNLVPNDDTLNVLMSNVEFKAGCRNIWHKHPGGQILIVTEGAGYYQEQGKPIQQIHKGDVIKIAPDVVH
jgi:quercetin dioxygenase-like cupin family protein